MVTVLQTQSMDSSKTKLEDDQKTNFDQLKQDMETGQISTHDATANSTDNSPKAPQLIDIFPPHPNDADDATKYKRQDHVSSFDQDDIPPPITQPEAPGDQPTQSGCMSPEQAAEEAVPPQPTMETPVVQATQQTEDEGLGVQQYVQNTSLDGEAHNGATRVTFEGPAEGPDPSQECNPPPSRSNSDYESALSIIGESEASLEEPKGTNSASRKCFLGKLH